ncbi:sodium/potassium/calcium exchanger 5-like [Onthophagus taurus]|uniref:sodium/potassium/calcium exchanger 5-like n=1 Tax=Onthophagus taurus TaxID=166361 RepID=UPI000C2041E3|nr:sodium/potassium/calcium exchanger 4-like [Onthophagus taurus]XP_022904881.1 sodium/potassium/calcium exchanger 4-like [Onthophagus taurus]
MGLFKLFLVISFVVVNTNQKEISSSIPNLLTYDVICENCALLNDSSPSIVPLKVDERKHPGIRIVKSTEDNETCGSSADDFPNFFTPEQRKSGAIIIHFVAALYCFFLVAIICDNYFIPCVEQIAIVLNLSEDVAAATFMSVATSAPELFVNIIGTFITKSDMGIGAIVGSSLFNTLGVVSIGGLAASAPIQLAWFPLMRDTILYICAISGLVVITWDGLIFWYEALCLFTGYFVYFVVMFQNQRISRFVHKMVGKFMKGEPEPDPKKFPDKEYKPSIDILRQPRPKYRDPPAPSISEDDVILTISEEPNLYKLPKGNIYTKIYFLYTWPLRFALYWTVPDSRKFPKLFPVTFVMCMVWIGCNSYIVSWLISIIGVTFGIPDAVLGLTFLGMVGCLGETFSIAIMSRKGEGKMGVSNALGANTMNILLSLGLPWFIQTLVLGADSDAYIYIESGAMEYVIMGLIVAAITLVVTLAFNRFKMSRLTGSITIFCYLCFLTLAVVSDLVLFPTECQ